jgi:hypothetical protein
MGLNMVDAGYVFQIPKLTFDEKQQVNVTEP